jgi:hypothetical protein
VKEWKKGRNRKEKGEIKVIARDKGEITDDRCTNTC